MSPEVHSFINSFINSFNSFIIIILVKKLHTNVLGSHIPDEIEHHEEFTPSVTTLCSLLVR